MKRQLDQQQLQHPPTDDWPGLDALPDDCLQMLFTFCEGPPQQSSAQEWLQRCEALAQCSQRLRALFRARCVPEDKEMAGLFRCLFVRYKYVSLGDPPCPLSLFLHLAHNEAYCRLAGACSREVGTLFTSLGMFVRNFDAYVKQGNFYAGSELYARLVDRAMLAPLQERLRTGAWEPTASQQLAFYFAYLHFAAESRNWIDYRLSEPVASSAYSSLHTYCEPPPERQCGHTVEYRARRYWLSGFQPLSETLRARSLAHGEELLCIRERPMDNEASRDTATPMHHIRKAMLENCGVVERWQRRQKWLGKLAKRLLTLVGAVTCEEAQK